MNIKREKISENVHFCAISDSRYKTNTVSINFVTDLSLETASANALLTYLLDKSNSEYPEYDDFAKYLNGMYKADINSGITTFANAQVISISASAIDNKYALMGENLTMGITKALCNCVLSPATENGIFIADRFANEKNNLINDINAAINDKRTYAINRTTEIMFEGKPCGIAKNGTVETASELNSEKTFEIYKELIAKSRIEIIFAGCGESEEIKKYIKDKFGKLGGKRDVEIVEFKATVDDKLKEVTEKFNVVQSKMVLGFKASECDEASFSVMTALYGGTPSSKLFKNVREKMSLCYYCAARQSVVTSSIKVDCGVENENIGKARAEILNQLELMKAGEITDDEITQTKLALINALKGVEDSPASVIAWYLNRILYGDLRTPAEQVSQYENVTKEQVIKAAQSLNLDTVYVLTGEDNNE